MLYLSLEDQKRDKSKVHGLLFPVEVSMPVYNTSSSRLEIPTRGKTFTKTDMNPSSKSLSRAKTILEIRQQAH